MKTNKEIIEESISCVIGESAMKEFYKKIVEKALELKDAEFIELIERFEEDIQMPITHKRVLLKLKELKEQINKGAEE